MTFERGTIPKTETKKMTSMSADIYQHKDTEALKLALAEFVLAKQRENIDHQTFVASQARAKKASENLTEVWFTTDREIVPENVVFEHGGNYYMVQIDTEGGSFHKIMPVDVVYFNKDHE